MSASSLSSRHSLKATGDIATSPQDDTLTASGLHPNGCLTLVATPIGNLADMPPRAVATLNAADIILCEDTRVTAKLLRAYGVSRPTQSFNDFNEVGRVPGILKKLHAGAQIALVSDAGTPLLSDPGYRLTRQAIQECITVYAIPGPHAATVALTLSGFPPLPYCVFGFLPPKDSARQRAIAQVVALEARGFSASLIWYEAPHRLQATLKTMKDLFGQTRLVAVCRELTKKFEETRRGTLGDVCAHFDAHPPRGEITIVLAPGEKETATPEDVDTMLQNALQTLSVKDAAASVATALDLSRRDVYRRALNLATRQPQSGD